MRLASSVSEDSGHPFQGVLEVDHFHGAGMIGEKNQRKSCFRMAVAVDAKSGFVYDFSSTSDERALGAFRSSLLASGEVKSGGDVASELGPYIYAGIP
jgi:hypothetical protein